MSDSAIKKSAEKPVEPKPEPTPPPAPVAKLGRASESGDAGIQILVAKRDIHVSNGNAEGVAEIDSDLAELGYAV